MYTKSRPCCQEREAFQSDLGVVLSRRLRLAREIVVSPTEACTTEKPGGHLVRRSPCTRPDGTFSTDPRAERSLHSNGVEKTAVPVDLPPFFPLPPAPSSITLT